MGGCSGFVSAVTFPKTERGNGDWVSGGDGGGEMQTGNLETGGLGKWNPSSTWGSCSLMLKKGQLSCWIYPLLSLLFCSCPSQTKETEEPQCGSGGKDFFEMRGQRWESPAILQMVQRRQRAEKKQRCKDQIREWKVSIERLLPRNV